MKLALITKIRKNLKAFQGACEKRNMDVEWRVELRAEKIEMRGVGGVLSRGELPKTLSRYICILFYLNNGIKIKLIAR